MSEKSEKSEKSETIVIQQKLQQYQEMLLNTILHVQQLYTYHAFTNSELIVALDAIRTVQMDVEQMMDGLLPISLQSINDKMAALFKLYGTHYFDDLLRVCLCGAKSQVDDGPGGMYSVLKRHFHPTGYSVTKSSTDHSLHRSLHLKCIDYYENSPFFKSKKNEQSNKPKSTKTTSTTVVQSNSAPILHYQLHGIKVYVLPNGLGQNMLVSGWLDCLPPKWMMHNTSVVKCWVQSEEKPAFSDILTLKDILTAKITVRQLECQTVQETLMKKSTSQIAKDFLASSLLTKRDMLLALIVSDTLEHQYLAYLLYDLLSNDQNGHIDTDTQMALFDSLPVQLKCKFKQVVQTTLNYTQQLSHTSVEIPLEQQICLLKVPNSVKEKAMMKLKDIKNKEDASSKSRQYLDGLLKIPFGIYRKEPILTIMDRVRTLYKEHCSTKDCSTDKESSVTCSAILQNILPQCNAQKAQWMQLTQSCNKQQCIAINHQLDAWINTKETYPWALPMSKPKLEQRMRRILTEQAHLIETIPLTNYLHGNIKTIHDLITSIPKQMAEVKRALDEAVYGHEPAKRQIERILGQWMHGKLDGYCFGFEGAPGLGKTSLAKRGLANCLKDENGETRPFAMIQMGGDSNGSTLHGHNFTYVGSTWGNIVQILIDKKCMNPIIFIDEVDKISHTEHGKELVGILTHLLDPAQNECFQDKYFAGIDLDLSKALFILSYNDPNAIDRILLDRVHRIPFENLTLKDKVTIAKKHILPEIYDKMCLTNTIYMSDEVITYIIDAFTYESGVRKLKEVLFEIIGEINLELMTNGDVTEFNEIHLTIDMIQSKYLKHKHCIVHATVSNRDLVGCINGLWANALGKGGIMPIQACWRPDASFLSLHLTGMQGDVMKESMSVALTLAWQLTSVEQQKKWSSLDLKSGIHIHCPEGATPKDGPSAGTAITVAIYSLLNERPIPREVAITGEICLNGNVKEIGGLDLKILGAIKAGVKKVLYPTENQRDLDRYLKASMLPNNHDGIEYQPVSSIQEVLVHLGLN